MRRIFVVPALAALLLSVAACGAKNETSTSSGDGPSAKSSSESTTSTTEKTTTTEGGSSDDGDDTDTTELDTGDLPNVPGNLGDCVDIATVYSSVMAQAGILMSPTASQEDLDKVADQLDAAKGKIPDEISDAFATWSAAWDDFAAEMEDISKNGGLTDPANLDKLESASEKLDAPEVKAANDEIEAYLKDKCGS